MSWKIGYAVKDKGGDILVRTVSDTEMRAQANWLWHFRRFAVPEEYTKADVQAAFMRRVVTSGESVVRVSITETS